MTRSSLRGRTLFSAALAVSMALLGARSAAAQSYLAIKNLAASEGNSPRGHLVKDADGTLYGTAPFGGEHGQGSVFKVDQDGNNFLVLHSFNTTDGSNPYSGVVLAGDGFLYGTTEVGGTDGDGVVFKIDTAGNNFSAIHHFDGANEGGEPWGGVVVSGTTLYGVARDHGANNFGTVYKLGTDGMNYAPIYTFGSGTTDGSHPYGGLLLGSDGRLYGTTEQGHNGTGLGTVFGVDTDGDNFATLHTFTAGNDGQDPQSRLIEGTDGFLYGTTVFGGSGSSGTAYKLLKSGGAYSVIHAFSSSDGTSPTASLTQVPGGLLYGTAKSGGTGGTLFHMTTSGGFFNVDHAFASASGNNPQGAVLFGNDSALYGAASGGGANNVGAVYRLTIPTLTSIDPTSGPSAGGTQVTLTGTGFENTGDVIIGGGVAVSMFLSPTQITSTVPGPLTPGTLNDVVVANPSPQIALLERAWLSDFLDVPQAEIFHDFIETIFRAGITAGYGNGYYGINDPNTRAQMAVFLLRGAFGGAYTPPACTGTFNDVPCPATGAFPYSDWIEDLFNRNITAGCTDNPPFSPPVYCPNSAITRAQMAVFLLKASLGAGYAPPACASHFNDVPCPPTAGFPYSNFIEDLFNRNITGGCTDNPPFSPPVYCPDAPATRGQMAVFLVRTFGLP